MVLVVLSGAFFGWFPSLCAAAVLSLSLTVFTIKSLRPKLLADASPMIRKYRIYVLAIAGVCQPVAILWGVLRPF